MSHVRFHFNNVVISKSDMVFPPRHGVADGNHRVNPVGHVFPACHQVRLASEARFIGREVARRRRGGGVPKSGKEYPPGARPPAGPGNRAGPLKVPGRGALAFLTAHFRLLPAPGKT